MMMQTSMALDQMIFRNHWTSVSCLVTGVLSTDNSFRDLKKEDFAELVAKERRQRRKLPAIYSRRFLRHVTVLGFINRE